MTEAPRLSVVVPVLDEEDNVLPMITRLREGLAGRGPWEVIFVDDGSEDNTSERVMELARRDSRIRLLRLARTYGQSTATQAGFDHARSRVVVTMDGDLQNDARDIPALVDELEQGYDLVAGYRERRQDHLVLRKIPSWIANRIIAGITGIRIRDNGCSLKAYKRGLLDRVRLYSDLHRFIPALAAASAGAKISEIPVRHHPRVSGRSKYGLSRTWKVLVDLTALKVVRSVRTSPLRLFGTAGISSGFAGLILGGLALELPGLVGVDPRPSVVLATASVLCFSLGVFLVMLGLVAEAAVNVRLRAGSRPAPLLHEIRL